MKKLLFLTVMAALLTSCSNDDVSDVFNDSSAAIITNTPNGSVVLKYASEADLDKCADFGMMIRLSNQKALNILTSNTDYSARFVFSFIGDSDSFHPMTFEANDVVMSDSTVNNEKVLIAKVKLTPEQLLNIGLGHYDVALNIYDSAERMVLSSDKQPVAVEWQEGYLEEIDYSKITPIDEDFLKQQEEEMEALKAQYEAWLKEQGITDATDKEMNDYSGPDRSDWMKNLKDDVQVNTLSLPGTHDAATKLADFRIFAATQPLDIPEQFKAGVRVFDLRPGTKGALITRDQTLSIMHGPINCHIQFKTAVKQIQECLEKHPTEFAIIIVSTNDGAQHTHDLVLVEETELYRDDASRMRYVRYFRNDITVGKMRGRIMFLNRDAFITNVPGTCPIGGYIEKWGGDDGKITSYSLSHDKQTMKVVSTAELRCQDMYELTLDPNDNNSVFNKKDLIKNRINTHSDRVKSNPHLTEWSINHNSGYISKGMFGPHPREAADFINPPILEFIETTHPQSTGIMMLDFAGVNFEDLDGLFHSTDEHSRIVGAIIDRNFKK